MIKIDNNYKRGWESHRNKCTKGVMSHWFYLIDRPLFFTLVCMLLKMTDDVAPHPQLPNTREGLFPLV